MKNSNLATPRFLAFSPNFNRFIVGGVIYISRQQHSTNTGSPCLLRALSLDTPSPFTHTQHLKGGAFHYEQTNTKAR